MNLRRTKRQKQAWDGYPVGITAADVTELYRRHPPTVARYIRRMTTHMRELDTAFKAFPDGK